MKVFKFGRGSFIRNLFDDFQPVNWSRKQYLECLKQNGPLEVIINKNQPNVEYRECKCGRSFWRDIGPDGTNLWAKHNVTD